ncbi:MAG TPA: hypothetical protein VGA09_16710, partial [Candidatus Binatia bacterium]
MLYFVRDDPAVFQSPLVSSHRPFRAVSVLLGVWFIALSLLLSSSAWSANEKIIFGWSAVSGAQAVPWITKDAGLFEKHGLDTTLLFLDGGSKAIQTLLSGEVPVVLGAGNSAVA